MTDAFTYRHPRPAVTVDTVLLSTAGSRPQIVLIKRGNEPFLDCWALPGGFLDMDEDLEAGARRELREETGLTAGPLLQVGAFGTPGRDPRGRTVSVVFAGVVPDPLHPAGGDDARSAALFSLDRLPALAFDHDAIIAASLAALRRAGHPV